MTRKIGECRVGMALWLAGFYEECITSLAPHRAWLGLVNFYGFNQAVPSSPCLQVQVPFCVPELVEWLEWAGKKVADKIVGAEAAMGVRTERVLLFPGWASRRYVQNPQFEEGACALCCTGCLC